MNSEKNRIVASAFNKNTAYFDMMREWHQGHEGLAVEYEVKGIIESRCAPGYLIMEAGCGEGSITNWFAERYKKVHFTGVDISGIGIDMARKRGLDNTEFKVADMKNLPFDDDTYDFVFSQSVLEHVVDWEVALREIYRIIRSGGEFLIRVGNGGTHNKSLLVAFLNYLFKRNKVSLEQPSFDLTSGDYDAHMTNFDVQEIPSDILMKELLATGFKVTFFSTRTQVFRTASLSWKSPFFYMLSLLKMWPFNHLGPTTIILVRK